MSRRVVDVGRRGLQLSNSLDANVLLPLSRARLSASSSAFAPSAPYTSVFPVGLSKLNRSPRFRNAAATATDTSFGWSRSATPELRSLLTKRLYHNFPRAPEIWTTGTTRLLVQRRWNSDSKSPPQKLPEKRAVEDTSKNSEASAAPLQQGKNDANLSTGAEGTKGFYGRLPHLHRPTKEELLAAATGFWHRLQIRFKWFSIRSVRPFNHEEIFAFASWIFWGHVLWFVIGTTTFMSLVILAMNTVFAQETLAGWVGNYLTRSSGLNVVFESAIVPRWSNGVITFNKVFVSRRPATTKNQRSVTKGSPETAAAAAAVAAQTVKEEKKDGPNDHSSVEEDDGNYTQFDITIDTVEVTLSFTKWFNGKGLLRDVEVRGVRGVLDRTHVQPRTEDVDPKSYRHEHNTGDFEIDNFKMGDVLLTIYQPNNFRPFQVSVYDCELPRLRKQWLFYDFLCASTAHGSFDNSLFTIHPRQVHGTTGVLLVDGREEEASQWKKHSRLRIDGLNIDHLNRGVEGPFSWIHEGNVDIVADVMIPNDADGSIAKVMSDFYDRMEATVTQQAQSSRSSNKPAESSNTINHHEDSLTHYQDDRASREQRPSPQTAPEEAAREEEDDRRFIVFDIEIHLNDVRASVPLFTKDLSYVNNAVVRPIVAYINSHAHGNRNYIPITCRIVKRLSEFDGSWTVFDSGLLDDLSRETYDAFVRDIMDRKARSRRIRKVGLWAAQVAAHALFVGLAGQLA